MRKALWLYTDNWSVSPSWIWEVQKKTGIDIKVKRYDEDFSPESFEEIFILTDSFSWDRERTLRFALERKVNPLKIRVFPWEEIQHAFPTKALQTFEHFFMDAIKRQKKPPSVKATQLLPEKRVLVTPRRETMLEEALSRLDIPYIVRKEPLLVKREGINFLLYDSPSGETVGAIILLPEWDEKPPLFIPPEVEETRRILPLNQFKNGMTRKTMRNKTLVFIVPPDSSSLLEDWKEVFGLSRRLAERERAQVFVLAQEIVVAGASLEQEYREARNQGVLFEKVRMDAVKLQPTLEMQGAWVEFETERDGYSLKIRADWVIYVPRRTYLPFPAIPWWKGEKEEEEFGDLENPNLPPFSSFLDGVFVFSRRDQDNFLQLAQAVEEYLNQGRLTLSECASVDEEKCVLCLTCFRTCPWRAVSIEGESKRKKARINWEQCHLCGICMAFCPASAIGINSLYTEDFFFIKSTWSEEQ